MSLYKPKGSNKYWANVKIEGRPRVRESTGTTDETEAALYEAKLRLSIMDGSYIPAKLRNQKTSRSSGFRLSDAFNRMLREVWNDKGYHSGMTKPVLDETGDPQLKDINDSFMAFYVGELLTKNNAKSTVNKKIRFIQQAMERASGIWGVELQAMPTWSLHRLKKAKKRHTFFLTHEKEDEILQNILARVKADPGEAWQDMHDYVITLIETGCRLSELLFAVPRDVNIQQYMIVIRDWDEDQSIKTDVVRSVPLTDRAVQVLARRMYQDKLWPGLRDKNHVSGLWEKVRNDCGLQPKKGQGIHCTRHTCGSRLASMGASQREIADWLGHKNLESTEVYVHLMPGRIDRLRQTMDNAARQSYPDGQPSLTEHFDREPESSPNGAEDLKPLSALRAVTPLNIKEKLVVQPCNQPFWEQDVGSSNLSTPTIIEYTFRYLPKDSEE